MWNVVGEYWSGSIDLTKSRGSLLNTRRTVEVPKTWCLFRLGICAYDHWYIFFKSRSNKQPLTSAFSEGNLRLPFCQKQTAKLSSTGAIISSVGAGRQRQGERSASMRNCPRDTRVQMRIPGRALKESLTVLPWLEKDCGELSLTVPAAAVAAHHCLACASLRQVPSAGAGAPHGSKRNELHDADKGSNMDIARTCQRTDARAQVRSCFATNTLNMNPS